MHCFLKICIGKYMYSFQSDLSMDIVNISHVYYSRDSRSISEQTLYTYKVYLILIEPNCTLIQIYSMIILFFKKILQYILPTIVAIGAIGNLINLVVLSSSDIKLTSRGHRVSQRSRSMFSYMKALAITDLLYLMMTIQGCVFTLMV